MSRTSGKARFVTGTTIMALEMASKRVDPARQLVPDTTAVAMLINPKFRIASTEAREVQEAARSFGIHINFLNASEIDAAFTTVVEQRNGALIIGMDPFLYGQRDQIVRLAARHKIPTIYFLGEFVEAGALISYGSNIANGYRQAGVYTGLVLNGANPADLPIVRPTQNSAAPARARRRGD